MRNERFDGGDQAGTVVQGQFVQGVFIGRRS
jgi:hypothetical protein